ncbi:hypothetical protein G7Y79_00028g062210 [Physcia stellaris]|nr:hypothetical protein G7Y79_00028g062210 [Physcia stellaris]
MAAPEITGAAKRDEIARLMGILELDFEQKNILPPQRNALLRELKTYIRTVEDSDPLFTLANGNREDELLNSRVLFLMTYGTTLSFHDLFDHHQLADSINSNIARHSKLYSKSNSKTPPSSADSLALSETLKLLFNLAQYYPQQSPNFAKSVPCVLKILNRIALPSPPLQPPVTYLINSLLNLDLESGSNKPLFPKSDEKCNVIRLTSILDIAVRTYKEEQLETLATPLLTLLRRVYELAPPSVAVHMKTLLLPSNEERAQPLGHSDTLAAWLLRLSTSPVAPNIRESISSLMFELSDKDATSFVRNVGYGFASGFLMTHDLPVPENALEGWSTGGSGSTGIEDLGEKVTNVDGNEINPVTGQRRDMEPEPPGPEMTDAEKEREAEKLFVLFERLKANGVINVENPVTKAVREGRFEELE